MLCSQALVVLIPFQGKRRFVYIFTQSATSDCCACKISIHNRACTWPVKSPIYKSARPWKKIHIIYITSAGCPWVCLSTRVNEFCHEPAREILHSTRINTSCFLFLWHWSAISFLLTFYCGKRWTAMLVLRLSPWERETLSSSASQMNITPFAFFKEMNSDISRKTAPVKRLNVCLSCRGGWPKTAHSIFSFLHWCYFIIILTQKLFDSFSLCRQWKGTYF